MYVHEPLEPICRKMCMQKYTFDISSGFLATGICSRFSISSTRFCLGGRHNLSVCSIMSRTESLPNDMLGDPGSLKPLERVVMCLRWQLASSFYAKQCFMWLLSFPSHEMPGQACQLNFGVQKPGPGPQRNKRGSTIEKACFPSKRKA